MSGTTEDNTDDNFSKAFDLLAEMGDKPVTPEVLAGTEPPPEPETPPVEGAAPQAEPETPPAEPEKPPVEGAAPPAEPETPPATPPAAAPPAEPGIKDVLDRLDTLKPPPAAEPPAEKPPVEEAPLYTKEEQDFLTKYQEDWPDVVKAEALIRRGEYRQFANFMFQQVAEALAPINAAMETVRTLAERTHLSDLRAEATDYDTIREKVIDWATKQPQYLRSAYESVITSGTVEEVKDLISRYREATGDTGKAAPVAAAPTKEPELPPAVKQAAAAMAPVSSKRSAVVQPVESGDFDSAFETFAKTG